MIVSYSRKIKQTDVKSKNNYNNDFVDYFLSRYRTKIKGNHDDDSALQNVLWCMSIFYGRRVRVLYGNRNTAWQILHPFKGAVNNFHRLNSLWFMDNSVLSRWYAGICLIRSIANVEGPERLIFIVNPKYRQYSVFAIQGFHLMSMLQRSLWS